jgi:hypothetical protein
MTTRMPRFQFFTAIASATSDSVTGIPLALHLCPHRAETRHGPRSEADLTLDITGAQKA